MPLFDDVDDQYLKTRELYKHWHRNDFLTHLVNASTGGPQQGVSGDSLLAQALWQRNATNQQLQRASDQVRIGTSKIQGIKVATTPPTNGQILIYNASEGQYVPGNTPGGGAQCTLAGNGNFVNNTQQTFTFNSGQSLEIAVSGNSIGVNSAPVAIQIPLPYAGTLKNMRLTASVVGSGTYTLQLMKNGTSTTIVNSQVAGGGTVTLNFSDLTHSVTVAAGDTIYYELTATVTTTLAIFGFSLEYDHA